MVILNFLLIIYLTTTIICLYYNMTLFQHYSILVLLSEKTAQGTVSNHVVKKCATSADCPMVGTTDFSTNLGYLGSGFASIHCCDTELCNSKTVPGM